MQEKQAYVGPRVWAMLILVGGATLASPFLRPPQVDLDVDATLTQSPLAHATSPSLGQLASAHNLATYPEPTSQDLTRGAQPASPPLPSWATPPSPIDGLISQGTAPPWNGDVPQSRIQPLQPWSDGRQPRALPSTNPSNSSAVNDATGLPASPWGAPPASAKLVPIASVAAATAWPDQPLPELPSTPPPASLDSRRSAGSLAGATVRTKTADTKPTSGDSKPVPQFVFQPGFQPDR